jgi:hypothetical protein
MLLVFASTELNCVDIIEQINLSKKINLNLNRVMLKLDADASHSSPHCFALINQISSYGNITELRVTKKYSSMKEDCTILFSLISDNPNLKTLGNLVRRNHLFGYLQIAKFAFFLAIPE